MRELAFKNLDNFFIGFNKLFNDFNAFDTLLSTKGIGLTSYPPYNIKETDKGHELEIAVAGLDSSDIDIELDGPTLTVSANTSTTDEKETDSYTYVGIANRKFKRQFRIGENVEIDNANLVNGLLTISFVNKEKLNDIKRIPISTPQALLESK